MITIPRESNELLPLPVEVNGVPVSTGVEYMITSQDGRPSDGVGSWLPAVVRDGEALARIQGLAKATYGMWTRTTRGDEEAVQFMGLFGIS